MTVCGDSQWFMVLTSVAVNSRVSLSLSILPSRESIGESYITLFTSLSLTFCFCSSTSVTEAIREVEKRNHFSESASKKISEKRFINALIRLDHISQFTSIEAN